jgi:hypothetical protein
MTDKEKTLQEEEFLDEQPLSDEDKELLETIYDRLDIFQQMNSPFHAEAMECRKILHMADPNQDDIRTRLEHGKETLQLNTLKATINNVVADQMLNMPEAKLLPETPEMQDAADDLQDLVHYVIYCANDFEQLHYRRCEDYYSTGTAVTQITWDQDMNYGKGEIALIRWPIESFLWDPTAERLQDCRAVMKVSWHPLSYYREHWPEKGKFVSSDDGTHNDVGLTEGQINAEHANDEERALMIEYWWRTYDAETRRYSINVAIAAGNALLEKEEDVYNHGLYPFTIDVHDSQEGSLPGLGLVREMVPTMRYINRYAAYADMNARMSSKSRLLISEAAGVDMEAISDWTNDIVTAQQRVDPQSLQWLQSPPFNSTIVQLMTMMQSDLKADSGANQFTRGETTGGIVSGKAINSLIQAGGKVASMRTEQLKYGFKDMVEQIIWLMSQFYEKDRTVMITGRSTAIHVDTERLFGKKSKEINPPPYTVQIEVSSRDPQRIANQNQMFMEAYTMSAQAQQFFPLSALFQILNLDGKDKILPVIRSNETYQQQMEQLQQQVEQLSAQMEGMQKENISLRKQVTDSTNTLARVAAAKGSVPQGMPVTDSTGNPVSAVVNQARNAMAQPTELPT